MITVKTKHTQYCIDHLKSEGYKVIDADKVKSVFATDVRPLFVLDVYSDRPAFEQMRRSKVAAEIGRYLLGEGTITFDTEEDEVHDNHTLMGKLMVVIP